jgi:hypothetical protein
LTSSVAPPTTSVLSLLDKLRQNNYRLIIIGDKKGPVAYDLPDTKFYSLQQQLDLPFSLAACCQKGTMLVRHRDIKAIPIKNQGWTNVYRYFTEELGWPRSLPALSAARNKP